MSYKIAGIDVHKKILAVVVSDVEGDGEYQFERVRYSTSPQHLRFLAEWLTAHQVEEVVMESTARILVQPSLQKLVKTSAPGFPTAAMSQWRIPPYPSK